MTSNFTIEYAFVAVDMFSKTAENINKALQKVRESLKLTGTNLKAAAVGMEAVGTAATATAASLAKLPEEVPMVLAAHSAIQKATKHSEVQTHGFIGSLELLNNKIREYGDKRSTASYYKMMSLGLPMFLVGRAGLKYVDTMDQAQEQLRIQFSQTNAQIKMQAEIMKQANIAQQTTPISAAQYVAGAAQLATITHNLAAAKALMPGLMNYAVYTHQTENLGAAAKTLMNAILAGKVLGTKLTGATAVERMSQAIEVLNRQLGGLAEKEGKTVSGEFAIMFHLFDQTAATLMDSLMPALQSVANVFAKIVNWLVPLIKNHQILTKAFMFASLTALALVVAETILGSVSTALTISFTLLISIVKYAAIAFKVLGLSLRWLTGTELLTNPFGWIIIGIGLAIYAVYKFIKTLELLYKTSPVFRQFVKNIGEEFKGMLIVINEVKDAVCYLINGIEILSNKIEKVGNAIKNFIHIRSPLGMNDKLNTNENRLNIFGLSNNVLQHRLDVNINVHDKNNNVKSVKANGSGNAVVNSNINLLGRNMFTSQLDSW